MRPPTITIVALAAVAPIVARAESMADCAPVPLPDAGDRAAYARGGPYAAGMVAAGKGRHREAVRLLAGAWGRVQARLARPFASERCDSVAIRRALSGSVFAAPPLAVPAEDRFLPPPAVLWTVAAEACAAGDVVTAAEWLSFAALAGDRKAAEGAASLLRAAGQVDLALAITRGGTDSPGGDTRARPPDGSFARVSVDGGVSPFTAVAYDVSVRGKTVVVSLVKESLCRVGQRERVRLLDGPEADALLAALAAAAVWEVPAPRGAVAGRARDSSPPRDGPRYEVWVGLGREMRRFHFDGASLMTSPATLAAVTAIREAVVSRVEPLPMRDLYHPAERIGYLTMTASEPARAVLDGWDEVRLPVDALEVVEGEHAVVVEGAGGKRREFTVRIVAGAAAQVHVVLE